MFSKSVLKIPGSVVLVISIWLLLSSLSNMFDALLKPEVISNPIWLLIILFRLLAFSKHENNLFSEKDEIVASIISKRIFFSLR